MEFGKSHLCYSLNVFPSDPDLAKRIGHIGEKFSLIREKLGISAKTPFALGFWADSVFVEQMVDTENLNLVKEFLAKNNFYVFTLNAFPYGQFHEKPVKEKVYLPDWTTDMRTDFTCKAADFLAQLLPEHIPGSISTLPGGYKKALNGFRRDFEEKIAENLQNVAEYLAELDRKLGTEIVLGIEMEPDCLWENPAEFIRFYRKYFSGNETVGKYLGVCYDTCHQELVGGLPGSGLKSLLDEGIRIAKIQLSTALETHKSATADFQALELFSDEVYLHQTRILNDKGKITKVYNDIPACCQDEFDDGHLVSHFHLPIFCSELPGNISPANGELKGVMKMLERNPEICPNLEIETYTYNVLPESLTSETMENNITEEYKWFLEKCRIT